MKEKTDSSIEDSYKSVTKGGAILFIGFFSMRILGYIFRLLLARLLGKESYGLVILAVSTIEVIALLSVIGIPISIPRFIGYYSGLNDQLKVKSTISTVLKISIPFSIIIAILLFNYSELIANSIYKKPQLTIILQFFAVCLPFINIRLVLESIITGFKKSYHYLLSNISLFVFLPLFFIILYHLGFKLKAAYYSYTISYVLSFSFALFITIKLIKQQNFPKEKSQSVFKELFSYSWPLIFNSMVWFLMVRIDTLMLGYYKTEASVGVYNAATPLAQFISLFLQSFGFLFLPVISEMYSKGNLKDLKTLYNLTLKWITALTIPLFLIFSVNAKETMFLFFGSEYIEAAPALSIIAIGYFMNAVIGLQSWILSATGRTKQLFINSCIGLVLNSILNYLFIPRYDIIGAALATAFTLTFYNLLGAYQIQKKYKIKTLRLKNLTFLIVGICATYLAKYIVGFFISLFSITGFAIYLIIFSIIYIAILPFIRFFSKEDKILFEVIAGKTGINLAFLDKFFR